MPSLRAIVCKGVPRQFGSRLRAKNRSWRSITWTMGPEGVLSSSSSSASSTSSPSSTSLSGSTTLRGGDDGRRGKEGHLESPQRVGDLDLARDLAQSRLPSFGWKVTPPSYLLTFRGGRFSLTSLEMPMIQLDVGRPRFAKALTVRSLS